MISARALYNILSAVHDVVFNTDLTNLVFWMSIVVDVQTVSIVVASASVVAGIVYYTFQIRHQTRMRQMDLLMRLYLTWDNEDMKKALQDVFALDFKDYDDFIKNYGLASQAYVSFDRVAWFMNGVGFLLHERFVNIKMVLALFHAQGWIMMWEKLKPVVVGVRKSFGFPESYAWFEYLHNEAKKRQQKGVTSG